MVFRMGEIVDTDVVRVRCTHELLVRRRGT